jgi:hypothetical protein
MAGGMVGSAWLTQPIRNITATTVAAMLAVAPDRFLLPAI